MMAGMNGGQCAYAMIREDLVSGRIRPGEKLMPQRLATRYGFSSAVLREALLKLSAEGFVENLPQRGFRSVSIDADTVWEIAHYRVLIEAEGARLSILRGDMKWEANLTAAHHLLSHLEEVMRGQDHSMEQLRYWSGCDRAFHEALIAACGSRRLIGQFRISLISSNSMSSPVIRPSVIGVRNWWQNMRIFCKRPWIGIRRPVPRRCGNTLIPIEDFPAAP